eukprot:CAMPEP_0172037682 /NCGR_PEP_ID=MMETSP1041-20130122/22890_1 /TAXON_ID=464988 /ORGANISM="Hemiselmis andersenii, Strain CCMP439" /LENGTH=53 /DNA_ID=CAMNT_0012695119 /DNA_START=27 /DNA_END=184 /DNA_ORIENTATION=+
MVAIPPIRSNIMIHCMIPTSLSSPSQCLFHVGAGEGGIGLAPMNVGNNTTSLA